MLEVKRLSINQESYQTIQVFTLSTFYLTTFLIGINVIIQLYQALCCI